MGGMQLFDGGSDSENDDVSKIKINEEYARRYEHNKKREDLQRFEELKKRGLVEDPSENSDSDSESSSSEDDDVVLANSKKKDLEFLDAIIKVKNRDPILKNKEVELFKSDETEKTQVKEDSKSKKKMYLKDVVAKHLIEEGPEFSEDEDEDEDEDITIKTYGEEQEQIRREFLDAAAKEEEEDGELLTVKDKNVVGDDDDDGIDNAEFEKKLDEYFGEDLDDNAKFLRDFFKNKMWVEKGSQGRGTEVREDDLELVSEDEMEIERQEEYEYRFQENAGDRVLGHSREVEGSVRKKVKARKEQRKSKEDRMEIARLEREEELRHLKNLKKKENDERLKKIMEIAGIKEGDVSLFGAKELEEEFDPQEYDRMMKKAFGMEYYEAEDVDSGFCSDMDEEGGDIEKPDFDKEDELLGLPKGWDSVGSSDGFLAAREKVLKLKKENHGDHEDDEGQKGGKEEEEEEEEEEDEEEEDEEEEEEDEEEEEEEKVSEEGKQEKKRKLAILERAKKEMMDEYYKLDYEDTIGDLKTRFKYAKIKPNRFGLTTAEILLMDEKELNQYVSLKKLAPYKEEWKVPNSKRFEIKKRAREILEQGKKGSKKNGKKLRIKDGAKEPNSSTGAIEHGKVGNSNGDMSKLSRSARRRQHQAARKLPPSRLMAYGLMPSKSKNKEKH